MSFAHLLKCITIGVGKSCLVLQFTEKDVPDGAPSAPTVAHASSPSMYCDRKTAGKESFRCITRSCYIGAAAALLVYDITKLEEARQLGSANLTICLVGNKCDLSDRRAVSYEEGERFAKEHGLLFTEASAKPAHNVDEAFTLTARAVCQKVENAVRLFEEYSVIKYLYGYLAPNAYGGGADI